MLEIGGQPIREIVDVERLLSDPGPVRPTVASLVRGRQPTSVTLPSFSGADFLPIWIQCLK